MTADAVAELVRKAGFALQPRTLGVVTWWTLMGKDGLPYAAGTLETIALHPAIRRLMSP